MAALTKLQKMQKNVPSIFKPTINKNIRGIQTALASADDRIVEQIRNAKEQLFVSLAQLQYLDSLGSNVGVFRPTVFNLSDTLYKQLIPALSYHPKQVITTIKTVLGIFFGENNSRVSVHEIRPNQIEITIPSSVPSLRRELAGSHHFHCYSGDIVSIDDVLKQVIIALDGGGSKVLDEGEVDGGLFGSSNKADIILSNFTTVAPAKTVIQFSDEVDLSKYSAGERFNLALKNYAGSFIPDTRKPYTVTKQRGVLGQTIEAGKVYSTLIMEEASGIPDGAGLLIFNFGKPNREALVKYFGRPNNKTLSIDPAHVFESEHVAGEMVNVIVTPYQKPDKSGEDLSVYIVGVRAARYLAQDIIESIKAAGVVINWTVIEPKISC